MSFHITRERRFNQLIPSLLHDLLPESASGVNLSYFTVAKSHWAHVSGCAIYVVETLIQVQPKELQVASEQFVEKGQE